MIDAFWNHFLEYRASRPNRRTRNRLFDIPSCSGVCVAADDPDEAERLLELIVQGSRTAEIRSLQSIQQTGEQLPPPDRYTILLDASGRPRCVLRSCGCHIVPFRQMPQEYAMMEGLDHSFRDWQERSRARFLQESRERRVVFSLDMPLVVSTFQVVYWED